jgi:dTDP-D-glucose 4,6-dehydratase
MKVMITGSAGFVFSNFVIYALQNTKWDIVSIDKLTYAGSLLNVPQVKRHKLYLGDVCDYHFVKRVFEIEKPDIVIHAAAESHVDNSIKDSHNFVITNVIGTHSMLEAALHVHTPEKFINVSCYDDQTMAVTKDGLKRFDEITTNDIVFTINQDTMCVEEQVVDKVIAQDYNGKMIRFKKSGVDAMVTPNHRIYDREMNVFEAKDVLNKDRLYFPLPKPKRGCDKECMVGGNKVDTKALFYLTGIYLGDGFTAYQEREVESKSGLNRTDFLKKSRDPKTGRFISTGKIGENNTCTCKSWRIFLDIPAGDKARKATEHALDALGIRFTKQSGKSREHLYFTSKDWVKYFDQFGKGARNKFIPRWMLGYDSEFLQCLFDGLIDSDGCRSKGLNIAFTTTSESLKDNICEIAIKIGVIPNVNYNYRESCLDGRKISGYAWHITFSKGRNKNITKNKTEEVSYNGKVWCIKVKNKNFLVERNGKYMFSGNTDEVYGSVEQGSSLETDMLEPRSPYSSTKASADLLGQSYFETHNLPIITTRCCNVFGSRQNREKLIPKVIINALTNKKIPVYGKGNQIRQWIYTKDVFSAIKCIIENGVPGEIYNISSDEERKNLDLVNFICDNISGSKHLIEFVKDRKGHDFRYTVDCSKLKLLGWEKKYNLDEALIHTVGWYKANTWFWR